MGGTCAVIASEIKAMLRFLRYPSFVLMICQGIFGSIPWIVLGNLNLYARLCGFEQWTLFWLGFPGLFGMLGGFLGGLVSDRLTKQMGPRGRPLTAMLTVGFGIPLQYMLWYGIHPGSFFNNVWTFVAIQVFFNLLANWAQPGCNFPVLGQIVTGKDRNKVMCWEMAFENTCATIIGSNAVPYVIQWLICFCVYSGLLWSFPLDVKRVEGEKAEEEARAVDDMELAAGAVAPGSSLTAAS